MRKKNAKTSLLPAGKMMIPIEWIGVFLRMVSDFFYRDALERSVVKLASQKVIIPGQFWILPGVGSVRVEEVDDKTVVYQAAIPKNVPDCFGHGWRHSYRVSRKEFAVWGEGPQEASFNDGGWSDEDASDDDSYDNSNVIHFGAKNESEI